MIGGVMEKNLPLSLVLSSVGHSNTPENEGFDGDSDLLNCKKAAINGNAHAQNRLGFMYELGRGVAQNDKEAVDWYRRAAKQGHIHAQLAIGFMCENGCGTEQDDVEAMKWYCAAAELGHVGAQCNVADLYSNGCGVIRSKEKAVMWYRRAAEQGHAHAQYCLGYLYQNGFGVFKSYVMAHMWWSIAAIAKASGAVTSRNFIEQKMTPSQLKRSAKLVKQWLDEHDNN